MRFFPTPHHRTPAQYRHTNQNPTRPSQKVVGRHNEMKTQGCDSHTATDSLESLRQCLHSSLAQQQPLACICLSRHRNKHCMACTEAARITVMPSAQPATESVAQSVNVKSVSFASAVTHNPCCCCCCCQTSPGTNPVAALCSPLRAGTHADTRVTPHPNPSVRVASSFVLGHAVHSVNFALCVTACILWCGFTASFCRTSPGRGV